MNRSCLLGGIIFLTLVFPVASVFAQTSSTLTQIQKLCGLEVQKRISVLNGLSGLITDNLDFSEQNKNLFLSAFSSDVAGLSTLKSLCENSRDTDSANSYINSVVSQYHIYDSVEPQTRLVAASYTLHSMNDNLRDLYTIYSQRILSLNNPPRLSQLLNQMKDTLQNIQSQTDKLDMITMSLYPQSPLSEPSIVNSSTASALLLLKSASSDTASVLAISQKIKSLLLLTTPYPTHASP